MKRILLPLTVSAFMAASCDSGKFFLQQEILNEETRTEEASMIPVALSIKGNRTKALSANPDESKINSLQVFIYTKDAEGVETYDSYYSFGADSEDYVIYIDPNRTDVSEYRFLTYVNRPAISEDAQDKDWALFSYESKTNFQMFGNESFSPAEILETNSISINVTRLCSKVEVREIATDWTNSVNSRKTFKLMGMYLMDVQGAFRNLHEIPETVESDITLWHNRSGHTSTSHDALLYDKIDGIEVTESEPYTDDHYLYGFISALTTYNANPLDTWSKGGTRLVIEAEFDGTPCYYPIPLNGIGNAGELSDIRNKEFIFNKITITKPGADQPYSPLPTETAVTVSLEVQTWQPGYSGDYTVE